MLNNNSEEDGVNKNIKTVKIDIYSLKAGFMPWKEAIIRSLDLQPFWSTNPIMILDKEQRKDLMNASDLMKTKQTQVERQEILGILATEKVFWKSALTWAWPRSIRAEKWVNMIYKNL